MAASARFFRRFTTTAGVLLLVTLLGSVAGAATASASSTYTASAYASRLAQLVNSARAQHGVAPLRIVSGTTTVAAGWTAQLARQRALSHNPDLIPELQRHGSASATDVAENVGQGLPNDPDGLFKAYMNSAEHRANILDRHLRYLGIAVDDAGSWAWNTMDFVDRYGSAATSGHASVKTGPGATRHVRATQTTAAKRPAAKRAVAHAPSQPARRISAAPAAVVHTQQAVWKQQRFREVNAANAVDSQVTTTGRHASEALIWVLAAGLVVGLAVTQLVLQRRFRSP